MGEITIKIPQNTNKMFEIGDPARAEDLLRILNGAKAKRKAAASKKRKDFSDLSKRLDERLANPDADTLYAMETADRLRNEWRR